MHEDKYFLLNEHHSIRYWEVGDKTNPAIVFLHGVGSAIESWCAQIEYLSKYFFTIFIDIDGFGKSRISNREYDRELFLDAFNIFIHKKGLEKFSLVGHSLGGFLSLAYANAHPVNINKLILIASAGFGIPSKRFKFFSSNFSQLCFLPFVKNRYLGPQIFKYFYGFGLPLLARKALACHWNDPVIKKSFVKVLKQDHEYRSVETASILFPSLVIWGKKDWVLDYHQGILAVSRIPNAKLILFDQSGHGIHADIPEKINSLILEFLTSDEDER